MEEAQSSESIGNYKILSIISEGMFGVVYLVTLGDRQYALKLFKNSGASTLVRFRRESSTIARLNNEHLIKIHDVGEHKGFPFLVMDLLKGDTLQAEISKQGQLTSQRSVEVLQALAKALTELHRNNLVHRDIKPSNIFITDEGKVYLIDLGLIGDIEQIEEDTSLVGTPLFCSPEQCKVLRRKVDFRSDLYSLGICLYNMLTGQVPFDGTLSEILQKHAAVPAPLVSDINKSVLPSVAAITAKLLAKDPDDRFQSSAGLLHDLERLVEVDKAIAAGEDPGLGKNDRTTLTQKVRYVERKAEQEILRSVWKKVLAGTPRAVIIKGTSGSGKSRLCTQLLQGISSNEALVLKAKSQFFDLENPFSPFREALGNFIEDLFERSEDERNPILARLKKAGAGREKYLMNLSKSFQRIFADTNLEKKDQSNLEGDRESFFNELASFFLEISKEFRALVFVIDDMQWVDQASLELLYSIFKSAAGKSFFLLATARSDEEYKQRLDLVNTTLGESLEQDIQISMFSPEQTDELVTQYLGARVVDISIRKMIYSHSNGNPFIAVEYMRACIEQGAFNFLSGAWHLDGVALEKLALNENVYELILKRIELSSQNAKTFLGCAALYGTTFPVGPVAQVLQMSAQDSLQVLKKCQELAIVESVSGDRWRFIHDKITESLINSMDPKLRKRLSSQLANHLYEDSDLSPDVVFLAARLYSQGEVENHLDRAILTHRRAGDLAKSHFAYADSYNFYNFAYTHLSDDAPAKAEIAYDLSYSATMTGDEKLATESINFSIERASSAATRAHSMALKVWILINQSSLVEAWEYFKEVAESIGHPYPRYLHYKVLNILWLWSLSIVLDFLPLRVSTNLYFRKKGLDGNKICNMYRDAVSCCEMRYDNMGLLLVSLKLVTMAQLTGDIKGRALGYASLSQTLGALGLGKLAKAYADRAANYCQTLGDPSITTPCEMKRMVGLFYSGELRDFEQEFNARREEFQKYLPPSELGRVTMIKAFIQSYSGRHLDSLGTLKHFVNLVERKVLRVTHIAHTTALNWIWRNLSALGMAQEAQRARAVALTHLDQLRFSPAQIRTATGSEIYERRFTEELGTVTEEIVTAWWKRSGSKFGDPINNNMAGFLTYVRLYQYENAKSDSQKLSARRELQGMLRHLSLTLFCPLFRSNYLFLKGAFYRVEKNSGLQRSIFFGPSV